MSKRLKAGIVGCGGIARNHVKGYQDNDVTIAALVDVNVEAAKTMAIELGDSVMIFRDCAEMIESEKVDMISVCTPPVAHEEAIGPALAKGAHVLCEKPLAHGMESGRRIEKMVDESDSVFMVAFRHRFLPAIRKMRSLIEEGVIGDPVFFQNVFAGPAFAMKDKWFCDKAVAGGGCMLDTSSHSVDLFRYMIGEVVERHAVFHTHFQGTNVEDAAVLTLKADNGALASLASGFVFGVGAAYIDVTGKDGELRYDYTCPTELITRKRGQQNEAVIPVEASNGFREQIAHFVNVINGRENLEVDINDGLRCLEIIQANDQGI